MKNGPKKVEILIKDAYLADLIREQLEIFGGIEIVESGGDVILSEEATDKSVPHLLFGSRNDLHESLTLPLRLGELTDRLRYIFSGRDRFAHSDSVSFMNLTLDADGVITDGGKTMRLTEKERLILQFLYQADNYSLDRKTLLQKVWGYAETAETHTLETHLYRLRQKLEEGFGTLELITTKDGIYTLNVTGPRQ